MTAFAADKERSGNDHQFAQWKKSLDTAKVKIVEELYKKIHAEIKKNPLKPRELKSLLNSKETLKTRMFSKEERRLSEEITKSPENKEELMFRKILLNSSLRENKYFACFFFRAESVFVF